MGLLLDSLIGTIPEYVFAGFQMVFKSILLHIDTRHMSKELSSLFVLLFSGFHG